MFDVKSFLENNNKLRAQVPDKLSSKGEFAIATISKKLSKISKESSLDAVHKIIYDEIIHKDLHELVPSNMRHTAIEEIANAILSVPIYAESAIWDKLRAGESSLNSGLFVFSGHYEARSHANELSLNIAYKMSIVCKYKCDKNGEVIFNIRVGGPSDFGIPKLKVVMDKLRDNCEKLSGTTYSISNFLDIVSLGEHVPKELYEIKQVAEKELVKVINSETAAFEEILKPTRFNKEYRKFLGI